MIGPFKYVADNGGTAELMRSSDIQGHIQQVAQEALEYATSIAPEFEGKYKASLSVSVGEENLPPSRPTRRVVAYLSTDAEHALAVEKDHHVLTRTRDYIEQRYGGGGRG